MTSAGTFTDGLRIQARVILALMLRESRARFGKHKLGYVWALFLPLSHVIMLMFIFTFAGRRLALGDSIPLFLATGIATYFGFRSVLSRTEGSYRSNESLLSFPPVKIIDVFLGRALLELATWLLVSTLLIGSLILLGHGPAPRSITMMLAAILALFAIAFGFGTFIGILTEFFPSIANLLRAPYRLLYITSGLFFVPETLLPAVRDILLWNPVLHGITLFRMGYYEYYDSFTFDGGYLLTWAVGSVFAALVSERVARKALRQLA